MKRERERERERAVELTGWRKRSAFMNVTTTQQMGKQRISQKSKGRERKRGKEGHQPKNKIKKLKMKVPIGEKIATTKGGKKIPQNPFL